MGRQESLIRIKTLAEVAGIQRAIEASEELKRFEYLDCFCAARARMPLYRGNEFGRPLSDVREDEEPIIMENELFAVVGGSRFYQYGKDFIWIDCIAGIREYDYVYFFEDISIRHAFEDAERNPQAALDAERLMRIRLNRAYNSDMQIGDRIALPAEYEEYARKLEQNEAGQEGRLPLVRLHW